jgi:Lrp/AsnC family transcriptional regulator for asnA, asnC and gidA
MDDLDRLILRSLQRDGRVPFTHVARQAGVSETTIRARYRGLLQSGIVRTVGVVDPLALDFEATALVAVTVEPGTADAIARTLSSAPEVSYLVRTLGTYDLILEVVCRDVSHLTDVVTDRVRQIPGVRATETFMIAESYKKPGDWSPLEDGAR